MRKQRLPFSASKAVMVKGNISMNDEKDFVKCMSACDDKRMHKSNTDDDR